MQCPVCGAFDVDYLGVADGAGDCGDILCDEYACNICGEIFERGCVAVSDATDLGDMLGFG